MNILVKREELWQSFLSLGSFEKSTEYYAALLEIASAKGKQIISPIYNIMKFVQMGKVYILL